MRILKYLAGTQPSEAMLFSEDNLLVHDGRIKMSDPFLSKVSLQ
jgi:hypothetical protein